MACLFLLVEGKGHGFGPYHGERDRGNSSDCLANVMNY